MVMTFTLTQRDVDKIINDLWQKRDRITEQVLPHLRRHFPNESPDTVEQRIREFLSCLYKEGPGNDLYYVECGRLKLEVGIEEEGLAWHYSIGFVEKHEDYLIDEDMSSLRMKEW